MNQRSIAALILTVAVAYIVFGRLALLLAIPPGYASPVWPAAGAAVALVIVLGRRVLPGVGLGSFVVNSWIGVDPADPLPGLVVASVIGLGATAQAALGAELVWRVLGRHPDLRSLGASLRFLALAGPISCLVGATVGVATLYAVGFVGPEAVPYSWATWWVGDATGAMVVAPLFLIWMTPGKRRMRLSLTIPALSVLGAAVVVFVVTSGYERERLQSEFDQTVTALRTALGQRITTHELTVDAVAGVFQLAPDATQEDLDDFAGQALGDQPGIQALEWIPRVAGVDREAWEAASGLTLKNTAGEPAPAAEWHYPVHLIHPMEPNRAALGLDLGTDPDRLAAIDEALRTQRSIGTRPIRIVQETGDQAGVLVISPGADGLGLGVFRLGDLVESAFGELPLDQLRVRLLYEGEVVYESVDVDVGELPEPRRTTLLIGRQVYELEVATASAWLDSHRRWDAWAALVAGLVICSVVSLTSLDLTGRTAQVEAMVAERTDALADANRRLGQANEQLAHSNRALERSNQELEDFAYVASHDLQEPLRMVASFGGLLREEYADRLDGNGVQYLGFLVDGAERMEAMVRDLLLLSRVRSQGAALVEVDGDEVLSEVLEDLSLRLVETDAEIMRQPIGMVHGDRGQLHRLFLNLVGNALKFRGEAAPVLRVDVSRADGRVRIAVVDNGIGIAEKHHERVLLPFQRLHARSKYPGTGIGLAVCKRIAERHGGELAVESEPGCGSTFTFSLADVVEV